MIHLFISDTGEATFVQTNDDTLPALQTMVDGLIEYHPCVRALTGLDCWVNEEAGFRPEFFTNYVASYETNLALRGSAVLSRSNEQGETVGLTDDDIKRITNIMEVQSGLCAEEYQKYLHNHRTEKTNPFDNPDEFVQQRFNTTPENIRQFHDRRKKEYLEANSL